MNQETNENPVASQMIENVNEDQQLAEEMRRRTVMRLSGMKKRGGLKGVKKFFTRDNAEIKEENEGSSPQNLDGSVTSGNDKGLSNGPKPFMKALSPGDSEGEKHIGYISPEKIMLSD